MNLRLKLILLFVSLILIPLVLISLLTASNTSQALISQVVDKLNAVSAAKEEELQVFITSQSDRVRGISSRTRLRELLSEYLETESEETKESILKILSDSISPFPDINSISIYTPDEKEVTSTSELSNEKKIVISEIVSQARENEILRFDRNLESIFAAGPIYLEDELIGVVFYEFESEVLGVLLSDYSGLGETGETLIASLNENGDAEFLHHRRFEDDSNSLAIIPKDRIDVPIIQALSRNETVMVEAEDYRGKNVIAATRYLEGVGWGLVVKVDQDELLRELNNFKFTLLSLLTIVMIFTGVIVYIVSRSIVDPFDILTNYSKLIIGGNYNANLRNEVINRNDEVGLLARTMNKMISDLRKFNEGLEQEVKERTIELEKATQRLKLATSSAGIGIWEWDVVNNKLEWDKQMYQLYGINEKEFGGAYESWVNGLHPEDKKKSDKAIKEALEGKKEFNTSFRVVYPDKTTRFLRAFATVIRDKSGKPIRMIGVNWDVSSEKAIDKQKSEFVSLASHQLRTPLTAINWHIEILEDELNKKLTNQQRKSLEEVATASRRMSDLVGSLLNVSRIELGTFAVEPVPTDLIKLMRSVLDELKPQIDEKELVVRSKQDKLPQIPVDPKLFRMVYQNLISNSVKYTPEKGYINIHHKLVGKVVRIVVADTGYGIPKEDQPKIFSKLFRADNVREKDTKGTGLGLYIIKSIIEQSGGRIWFESPYKVKNGDGLDDVGGTAFYVEIPLGGMKKKSGSKPLE